MSSAAIYRQKAEELLRQATASDDMRERSNLISEAVRWHMMAREAEGLAEADNDLSWLDLDPDQPEP